jgi:hypothetical protein
VRDDVREALESVQSTGLRGSSGPSRPRSFENVRQIVQRFLAELPEDMTVLDIRAELE